MFGSSYDDLAECIPSATPFPAGMLMKLCTLLIWQCIVFMRGLPGSEPVLFPRTDYPVGWPLVSSAWHSALLTLQVA